MLGQIRERQPKRAVRVVVDERGAARRPGVDPLVALVLLVALAGAALIVSLLARCSW